VVALRARTRTRHGYGARSGGCLGIRLPRGRWWPAAWSGKRWPDLRTLSVAWPSSDRTRTSLRRSVTSIAAPAAGERELRRAKMTHPPASITRPPAVPSTCGGAPCGSSPAAGRTEARPIRASSWSACCLIGGDAPAICRGVGAAAGLHARSAAKVLAGGHQHERIARRLVSVSWGRAFGRATPRNASATRVPSHAPAALWPPRVPVERCMRLAATPISASAPAKVRRIAAPRASSNAISGRNGEPTPRCIPVSAQNTMTPARSATTRAGTRRSR
jgi:hypothetical protein